MKNNKKKPENILSFLAERSLLKQDVFCVSKEMFQSFKGILSVKIEEFKKELDNEKVRLQFVDKSEFEAYAYVGSDILVFSMHSNVFTFPKEHAIWKTSYVEKDADRAYCGVIHIYNFLADSFLYSRQNDYGYLLGRVYINKDKHFFIEGKGSLGIQYRDFVNGELDNKVVDEIINAAIANAAEFDLLSPPYEMMSAISVQQMQEMSSSAQMKTGKRLGFRFNSDSDKII